MIVSGRSRLRAAASPMYAANFVSGFSRIVHVLKTTTSASPCVGASPRPSSSSMPLMRSESCAFIWHPNVVTAYVRTCPGYPLVPPLRTVETAGVSGSPYVLGHSEHELERLARQAALIGPVTRALLVE